MSRIRIIRRSAIEQFASVVNTYRSKIYRLWLISPWISMYTDGTTDPLQLMVDAVRTKPRCMVTVITRQPKKKDAWHSDALTLLKNNVRPTIFFCETLHTKLYILECENFVCAMLGSPNLTAGGNSANIELALEVRNHSLRTKDEVTWMLRELVDYARGLLADDEVKLAS